MCNRERSFGCISLFRLSTHQHNQQSMTWKDELSPESSSTHSRSRTDNVARFTVISLSDSIHDCGGPPVPHGASFNCLEHARLPLRMNGNLGAEDVASQQWLLFCPLSCHGRFPVEASVEHIILITESLFLHHFDRCAGIHF